MLIVYILILILTGLFLIGSYSAIVVGTTWGAWVTGICLWALLGIISGVSVFMR